MPGICRHNELIALSCPNISGLHYFSNPLPGHFLPLSSQLLSDPWTAIGFMTVIKNIHNFYQQVFILLPASRWTIFKLFIITAFSHLKYSAHLLNGKSGSVITYKLVDFPSLLEKMLTAFFRMSLSICASRSSFFNRSFSLSKSVIFGFPWPGKLLFSYLWYSLRQRYNSSGWISNSSSISLALPCANESSTAFRLNSRSYFCLFCVIMAIYYFFVA